MAVKSRLSSEERRVAIMKAVLPLFARHGLHGVKTRQLAEEAGVSEALIFKHFPTKEALFEAIQQGVSDTEAADPQAERFLASSSSTAKLVLGVHGLIHHVCFHRDPMHVRILIQSLLSDGDFARHWFKATRKRWLPLYKREFAAARKAGDLESDGLPDDMAFWFIQHIALALLLIALPGSPTIDYGDKREAVVRRAVRFCLRGLGLKDAAIRRWYDTGAYARS